MDLRTTEKKIRETESAIRRDLAEITKTEGLIKRYQDRKRTLESRVKDNRTALANMKNRRAVLIIEEEIGTMDENKLFLLRDFLEEHGDAFGGKVPEGNEVEDERETGDHPPVGQ